MVKAGEVTVELRGKDVNLKKVLDDSDNDLKRWKRFAADAFNSTRTASEKYESEVKALDIALKKGLITQETYNRALKGAKSNMELMEAQARGGKKGVNKLGIAMQQASFGVQDFTQVIGQTGLAGALRASANNWSQVLAVINPFLGAIGGVAITVGSILVADMLSAKKATDEFKDSITDLADALRLLDEARERKAKGEAFVEEGDLAGLEKELDAKKKLLAERTKAGGDVQVAETARDVALLDVIDESVKSSLFQTEEANKAKFGRSLRNVQNIPDLPTIAKGLPTNSEVVRQRKADAARADRALGRDGGPRAPTDLLRLAAEDRGLNKELKERVDPQQAELDKLKTDNEKLRKDIQASEKNLAETRAASAKKANREIEEELDARKKLVREVDDQFKERVAAGADPQRAFRAGQKRIDDFDEKVREKQQRVADADQRKKDAIQKKADARAKKESDLNAKIDAELNPAGARVGKILKEFEDRIAAGADRGRAGDAAEQKLDALTKKGRASKSQFGFAGISQLGDQIQQALLTDPAKKAQEDTAKNTKEMVANGKKQLAELKKPKPGAVGK